MAEKKTTKKAVEKEIMTVVGGSLNIRKSASKDAEIVGILPDGAEVEVTSKKDGFCKIKEGYVVSDFLK